MKLVKKVTIMDKLIIDLLKYEIETLSKLNRFECLLNKTGFIGQLEIDLPCLNYKIFHIILTKLGIPEDYEESRDDYINLYYSECQKNTQISDKRIKNFIREVKKLYENKKRVREQ